MHRPNHHCTNRNDPHDEEQEDKQKLSLPLRLSLNGNYTLATMNPWGRLVGWTLLKGGSYAHESQLCGSQAHSNGGLIAASTSWFQLGTCGKALPGLLKLQCESALLSVSWMPAGRPARKIQELGTDTGYHTADPGMRTYPVRLWYRHCPTAAFGACSATQCCPNSDSGSRHHRQSGLTGCCLLTGAK